jgi:hypothetical protein
MLIDDVSSSPPSCTDVPTRCLKDVRTLQGRATVAGAARESLGHRCFRLVELQSRSLISAIEDRREALDDEEASERPELFAALRRLIHSVVVHAEPGVKGPLNLEIRGPPARAARRIVLETFCGWGTRSSGGPLRPTTPRNGWAVFSSKRSRFWSQNLKFAMLVRYHHTPAYPISRCKPALAARADIRRISWNVCHGAKIGCEQSQQTARLFKIGQ